MLMAVIVSAVVCALCALLSFFAGINLWRHAPTAILLLLLVWTFMHRGHYKHMADGVLRYVQNHSSEYQATSDDLKFLKLNAGYLFPKSMYLTYFARVEANVEGTYVFLGAIIWGVVCFFRGAHGSAAVCVVILLIYFLSDWKYFSTGDENHDALMMAHRWFKATGTKDPTNLHIMEVESLIRRCTDLLNKVGQDASKTK